MNETREVQKQDIDQVVVLLKAILELLKKIEANQPALEMEQ